MGWFSSTPKDFSDKEKELYKQLLAKGVSKADAEYYVKRQRGTSDNNDWDQKTDYSNNQHFKDRPRTFESKLRDVLRSITETKK